jgi:ABC-2 type transport system permease protein
MNAQRVIALAKKDLKKTIREPSLIFMLMLFPVVITIAFGTSFGAIGGSQPASYQIGIVNNEAGGNQTWSQIFVNGLSGTKILNIQVYPDNQTAQAELAQGKIQALIVIPSNFEESSNSYRAKPNDPGSWVNTTLGVYLDSGSMFATQVISPIIQQVLSATVYGDSQSVARPIQLGIPSMVDTKKTSAFDYMVPGIFAFASIFLIMTVAQSFTSDRESGLLKRIKVTPTTSTEYIMSQAASNMVLASIQVAIVFAMSYLVGFRPSVVIINFVFAFVLMMIFSLCNVGFGLITATIAKSSGAATGLAFVFIMPQLFLGTFVGSALSSTAQSIGKFVPSYYATDALTTLFLRAAPITSTAVLFDLTVVTLCSVAVLLIGIMLFSKHSRV